MFAEVLATQVSATECVVAATPVPDTFREPGELLALLVTVTVPVTLPAALGAKSTLRTAVCPAARVAPLTPLSTLKPLPLAVTCDTVRLEFPVLVRVTPSVFDCPTVSLPKFKLEADICSVRVGVPPEPLTAIDASTVPLLFLSNTEPVILPETIGRKATVK